MEEILTIVGVIFVGLNLGIMHTYMQKPEKASGPEQEFTNLAIPTTINTFMIVFLLWGIYESNKSDLMKILLVSILILSTIFELYFIYNKESNKDLRGFYTFLIYCSSLLKLYLLITLHADVSSKVSRKLVSNIKFQKPKLNPQQQSQQSQQPQQKPREPREVFEIDLGSAERIFQDILNKTDLTPEEKVEYEDRFSNAFEEEQPWQKANDTLSSVLNKVQEEKLSRDDKQDLRNKFRVAMGRQPK